MSHPNRQNTPAQNLLHAIAAKYMIDRDLMGRPVDKHFVPYGVRTVQSKHRHGGAVAHRKWKRVRASGRS